MNSLKLFSLIGLVLYFAILLFSVTREKKNTNILDYFFAGRTLPFWALSITFIASWWGAGSALSTADLAFNDGLGAFFYYGVPVLISTFLMILGAKAIRRVGYLTQGKMFEARYSKFSAKILSFMILLFMIFNAAAQMVGLGDFLGTYLGINYEAGILLGTSIVLIYSVFGGFRGVVLTDIIQFVLLLLSAIIIFTVAMLNSGGFSEIALKATSIGKDEFMNIGSGASRYFAYVITFGCSWMIQANVWQRISATKNDLDAKKMSVMSFLAYIPLYLIVVLTGMAGITLYDSMPEGGIVTALVMDYLPPILGALAFIGISSAIMSTMDSLLNTAAMTFVIDLLPHQKDAKKQIQLSKFATLFVSCIALIISLKIRSILEVAWIASDIITTGVFIPLLVGFFWKRGNSKGANVAMMTGLIFSTYNLLISFGLNLPAFYEPQSAMQVLVGVGISSFLYVVVSLATAPETQKATNFIEKAKGKS